MPPPHHHYSNLSAAAAAAAAADNNEWLSSLDAWTSSVAPGIYLESEGSGSGGRSVEQFAAFLDHITESSECGSNGRVSERIELLKLLTVTPTDGLTRVLNEAGLFRHLNGWLQAQVTILESAHTTVPSDVSYELIIQIINLLKVLPLSASNLKENSTGRLLKKLTRIDEDLYSDIVKLSCELVDQWKELIKENNITLMSKTNKQQSSTKMKSHNLGESDDTNSTDLETSVKSILQETSLILPASLQPKVTFLTGSDNNIERSFVPFNFEDAPHSKHKDIDHLRRLEQSMDRNANHALLNIFFIEWYTPIKLVNTKFQDVKVDSIEREIQQKKIEGTLRDINLNLDCESPAEPDADDDALVTRNNPKTSKTDLENDLQGQADTDSDSFAKRNNPDDVRLSDFGENDSVPIIPLASSSAEYYNLFSEPNMQNKKVEANSSIDPLRSTKAFQIPNCLNSSKLVHPYFNLPEMYKNMLQTPPPQTNPATADAPQLQNSPQCPPINNSNNNFLIMPIPQSALPKAAAPPAALPQLPLKHLGVVNHRVPNARPPMPCNHYFTKGWCKFKNQCVFSHSIEDANKMWAPNNNATMPEPVNHQS